MFDENMISDSDIAIIGMSCRFPDATSTDAFWQNLCQAKESISFFSDEELLASGVDPALLNDSNYVKAGTVLQDYDGFDAFFFGLTPREAEMLDPQHRLFLECAWEAIESAGYNTSAYQGAIGVYGGTSLNRYLLKNLYPNRHLFESGGGYQLMLNSDKDFLPTRVSYKLNLTGPSVNVQTACSTSLVAVHLACQSLLSGECDIALAGGVSVSVPQKKGYLYQKGMIFSPDGHCRAFDAQAQGTVRGQGVGIVALKRLEDAVADGDTIHAIIKGSAINNDGSLKVGYTAPSVDGQAKVIREAQAVAGVEPETITYIEAHGTGTVLGDPIEIAALTQAFQTQENHTLGKRYCAIGSVKNNIGHADAAAGVAGLIKTVLALKHRLIPPTLHFEKPNPNIDFANSPFYVNSELSDWKSDGPPRRAGVSSFGIGGTNAHLVLEEALPRHPSSESSRWQLLLLSAKTPSALDNATANLAEHLKQHPDLNLADVGYTLAIGRQQHPYRQMWLCQGLNDAISRLSRDDSVSLHANFSEQRERPVVFMFPGQGTQYVNMGQELYEVEPIFREQVDICAGILKPTLGLDLRRLMYPTGGIQTKDSYKKMNTTLMAQMTIFVTSYALAKLWLSWGGAPQAMIGHSIGEYVAACLAGVFSLEDALALVATRGRLMQSLGVYGQGAMLAVPLSEEELFHRVDEKQSYAQGLSLAAINEPSQVVVSGPIDAIYALQKQLFDSGVTSRRLHTSHAFHSAMMDPILAPFTEQVKRVPLHSPQIPYISNVTGTWITEAEATNPTYWAKHLRQTVRFAEGLAELLKVPNLILLEVGPGRTLSTLAKRHPLKSNQAVLRSLRHPREEQSDMAFLLTTLGQFWLAGGAIDWARFYAHQRRHRLPLPTYPFERQRYWIEAPSEPWASDRSQQSMPRRQKIDQWFYTPSWKHQPLPVQSLSGHHVWLLFMDEAGLGLQLAEALRQIEQSVITVQIGEVFAQRSEKSFVMDPASRDDYSALWRSLKTTPQKIIHLWNVSNTPATDEPTEIVGFYSLLYLSQVLGEHNVTKKLNVFILSNHLHNVTGADEIMPIKATLLGPTRVLPQEYQNITCSSVDVVWPAATTVTQLLTEFATVSEEPVVAYRGSRRWLACAEPIKLPPPANLIRTGGVYLITGGLGGIGLTLAQALASHSTKLVLLGRSAFPTRDVWDEWLATQPAEDSISQKIRVLQRMEAMGAEILVISADVTDRDAMQKTIKKVVDCFGTIHGVIHSAGVLPNNTPMPQTKPEAAAQVLAPKVHGTQVLAEVLYDLPLDFVVLCSSLSTILGGFGRVAYTAANAFQDAFAQSQSAEYPILSINWDGWRDVGMVTQQTVSDENYEAVSPEEGVQLFFQALGRGLRQLIVSVYELQKIVRRTRSLQALQKLAPAHTQTHRRPEMSVDYAAPRTPTERWLADIWQEYLKIEPIGIEDDFFTHLAGDSLNGMGLINSIQEQLGAIIHLAAVFEAPTIAKMASFLDENYRNELVQVGVIPRPQEVAADGMTPVLRITPEVVTQVHRGLSELHPHLATYTHTTKCPPAIFILSPPRSGSTLLRVMLTGHPKLFAPPELGLLMYNTLGELGENNTNRQSLIRTLMQINNCDVNEAKQQLAQYEAQNLSVPSFYQMLQTSIENRLLVDKSPPYTFDRAFLQKAEKLFEDALYIHLWRHPYGMIRSSEESRSFLFTNGLLSNFSQREISEAAWLISNQNILAFLSQVPASRHCQIKFEQLVTEPEATLARLCQFLKLEFMPAMLDIYQDPRQRMTDGVHEVGRMMGDPKFHQHKGINPAVATQWQEAISSDFLSDMTWTLAQQVGYTERVEPVAPKTTSKNGAIAPFDPSTRRLAQDTASGHRRLRAPLRAASKSPLFCVPGVGGNPLSLSQLARHFDSERLFVGLQAVGLDGQSAPLTTMEAVAAHHIREIKRIQPQGPYYLAGHSFGGRVVFEMTRQLHHEGEEVARLFIFDAPLLTLATDLDTTGWDQAKWFILISQLMGGYNSSEIEPLQETLTHLAPDKQFNYFKNWLERVMLLPAGSDKQLRAWVEVFKANVELDGSPQATISVPVTLFLAEERNAWREAILQENSTLGWNIFVDNAVTTIFVPGNHSSMLAHPHVQVLAKRLSECLASEEVGRRN